MEKIFLKDVADDKLKSIIRDGIKHYRDPQHKFSQFKLERTGVNAELWSYFIHSNFSDDEIKKVDAFYEEIVNSWV